MFELERLWGKQLVRRTGCPMEEEELLQRLQHRPLDRTRERRESRVDRNRHHHSRSLDLLHRLLYCRKKRQRVVGELVFPPGTFKSGCSLAIDHGEEPESRKDSCAKSEEHLSPILSIVALNDRCGDVSRLPREVRIRLIGAKASKSGDVCLAFSENREQPWKSFSTPPRLATSRPCSLPLL